MPAIKKFMDSQILHSTRTSAPGFLVAIPLNWLFDRIPGFNKVEANLESIQKKFGVLVKVVLVYYRCSQWAFSWL